MNAEVEAHPPPPDEATDTLAARLGPLMLRGATIGAGAALGLWSADVCLLWSQRTSTTSGRWLMGVGSALFVALTTSVVGGAVLAPLLARPMASFARRLSALRSGVRARREETILELGAQAITLTTWVPLLGWVAFQVSLVVPAEFARAESIAGVLALSHLAVAALMVLGWSSWAYFAHGLLGLATRVPGLRRVVRQPWGVPGLLLVVALALGAKLIVANWEEIRELPWHDALPLPGLLIGIVAGAYVSRSSVVWHGNASLAVVSVALVASSIPALLLRPEATSARRIAFEESLAGRVGYAAWTFAFDFDRDGQLGILGGGDCAPFDARRHTGAIDVPGNGVDEDCDGMDLKPVAFRPRVAPQVGQATLPRRPTIVLVTVDGLAARKLQVLGNTKSLMPNVDALAARGALFTECFSEGPSTRLSFPSMFTSRWDSQLRQEYAPTHPYPLAASERQLQDVLDDAGYETVAVLPARYFEPRKWASATRGFQRVDASAVPTRMHNAPLVTDAALRILAEASARPRYLWVHYYDAHGPYAAIPGVTYPAHPTDEDFYDADLTFIDHEIGRLAAALDARTDPTYVLLTADHGSLFGELQRPRRHHYGDDLSTAVLNVPLIVVGPGIEPRRIDGLASTMDILPTLADLVQVKTKIEVEGESLWPEILKGIVDPSRVLFHEVYLGERDFQGRDPLEQVSVRDSEWNLTLDRLRGTYHLFDYTKDYGEKHDLYEDQGRSAHALKLRALLGGFVAAFHKRAPGPPCLLPLRKSGERVRSCRTAA